MGVIKLSAEDAIEMLIENFRREKDQLKTGLDLDAQIMLSLIIERQKTSEKAQKPSYHDLYICLRDKATYILENGNKIDLIDQSGIEVPEKQYMARVNFLEQHNTEYRPRNYLDTLTTRHDEEWGMIYAPTEEVTSALKSIMGFVEELERHKINIQELCPQAQTDWDEAVSVSVAGLGEYFNRFHHFPGTSLHENYHSLRKRSGKEEDIIFLPGTKTIIIPETGQTLLC